MSASDTFESSKEFAAHLRSLQRTRRDRKLELREQVVRKSLSRTEREQIFVKTAGRCHICGGLIDGEWEADHVFSHSLGGQHEVGNYLPAHPICNNYRWFYGTEEFQWILKLGVWLRTQIETGENSALRLAERFVQHEARRDSRRKRRDN